MPEQKLAVLESAILSPACAEEQLQLLRMPMTLKLSHMAKVSSEHCCLASQQRYRPRISDNSIPFLERMESIDLVEVRVSAPCLDVIVLAMLPL